MNAYERMRARDQANDKCVVIWYFWNTYVWHVSDYDADAGDGDGNVYPPTSSRNREAKRYNRRLDVL